MSERWLRSAPFFVMLVLAALLAAGVFKGAPEATDQVRTGLQLTTFKVPALAGGSEFSPNLWAGKIALLNVFASWCTPCAIEHPALMNLSRTGKLAIYGLAWKDKADKVNAYLEKHSNPYQAVGLDELGASTIPLSLTGVPETYLLDKDNVIRYHSKAPLTDDIITTQIIPLVDKLTGDAYEKPDGRP